MDAVLLTQPNINWIEYIKLGQKHLSLSPTKGLDDQRIEVGDTKSFLMSLAYVMNNSIKDWQSSKLTNMVDLHFAVVGTLLQINLLYNIVPMIHLTVESGEKQFTIFKAPLNDWRHLIVEGSNHKEFEIRRCCNIMYLQLERAGLKEVFHSYTKIGNPDQTFRLKLR